MEGIINSLSSLSSPSSVFEHFPSQPLPTILLLPGIGDIIWALTKMESFIEKELQGRKPDVWIWDLDGRKRSIELLQSVPFVNAKGYFECHMRLLERDDYPSLEVFRQAYLFQGPSLWKNYLGFDYFICPNGEMRTLGKNLEEILPEFETNWRFPLLPDPAATNLGMSLSERGGPFVILFISSMGMFSNWVEHLGSGKIARMIAEKVHEEDIDVYLMGSEWDIEFNREVDAVIAMSYPKEISQRVHQICGQTNYTLFRGMIEWASEVIGWCGGHTILSAVLHSRLLSPTKTTIIWSDYFPEKRFWENATPKGSCVNLDVKDVESFLNQSRMKEMNEEREERKPAASADQ